MFLKLHISLFFSLLFFSYCCCLRERREGREGEKAKEKKKKKRKRKRKEKKNGCFFCFFWLTGGRVGRNTSDSISSTVGFVG